MEVLSKLYIEISSQIASEEAIGKNLNEEEESDSTENEYSAEEVNMRDIELKDPMSYIAHTILNLNEFMTKQ